MLPLRKDDLYPLQAFRRAMWRLEHILLVKEECPSYSVPLPMLCSAFSHEGALAEAVDVKELDDDDSSVAPRGHYDVLEWVGDAVLHLLATAAVMLESDRANEGELTRAREMIEQNLSLCRKSVRMGLPVDHAQHAIRQECS